MIQTENYEICLRLSQAEKEKLCSDAKQCGLSKTAYLRRLISGKEVKALPTKELKELRTEIHKIGNNINQIARKMNAGIAREKEANYAIQLLAQVYELMYQVGATCSATSLKR